MKPAFPEPAKSTSGITIGGRHFSRTSVAILAVCIVVALPALFGMGGSDGSSPSPSEAFCNDLRDGATIMNLWDRETDPEKFAGKSYGRMAISCPEQLERFRGYFEGWGINIDA
jgi:hypothetical protein